MPKLFALIALVAGLSASAQAQEARSQSGMALTACDEATLGFFHRLEERITEHLATLRQRQARISRFIDRYEAWQREMASGPADGALARSQAAWARQASESSI